MAKKIIQLFMMFFFPFQFQAMEVIGLFANTLNKSVRLYDRNSNFFVTVQPDQEIPLRQESFIILTANNKTLKEYDVEKYFYSYTYLDDTGNEKLLTLECIQNWCNASRTFNVRTGNLRPQDADTAQFLKERLAQIKLYNSN